jgi:hypothetical protein
MFGFAEVYCHILDGLERRSWYSGPEHSFLHGTGWKMSATDLRSKSITILTQVITHDITLNQLGRTRQVRGLSYWVDVL